MGASIVDDLDFWIGHLGRWTGIYGGKDFKKGKKIMDLILATLTLKISSVRLM